jgi:hypothetical protein
MSLDSITDKTTKFYLNKGFEIKEKPIKKIFDNFNFVVKIYFLISCENNNFCDFFVVNFCEFL